MKSLWKAWVQFWSRRESATSLALFRILAASVLLCIMIDVVRSDLVQLMWVQKEDGGYRQLAQPFWLIRLFGGATPAVVWSFVVLCIASSVLTLVGLGGRWPVLLAQQSFLALARSNLHTGGSYDELLQNALLLLFFAPATATLSVDCWRRTGRWVDSTAVSAVVRYLAVVQLVLMYWSTGIQKLSIHWTPGGDFHALYYILQQPSWQRFEMQWLAPHAWTTQIATATVWFWEVLSPIWLMAFFFALRPEKPGWIRGAFRRLRITTLFASLGIAFHLGIALTLDVGAFSWVSLAFYVCLLAPEKWESLGRRALRRQ